MRNPRDKEPPESLRQALESFAAHLRAPDQHPAPGGIEDRRMEIYRGLFFRNIRNFLSGNFPVLRKLHDDDAWDSLTRAFYHHHRSTTPLFPEIAREFLKYLQDERAPEPRDPPFMLELAHYEWVELALSLDEQELDAIDANPEGDLLAEQPVLSPLAWPLSYRYPVHQIRPEFQPQDAPGEATHLLVYRNRRDKVNFMQLNAVSLLLMHILKEPGALTGLDVLKRLAGEINHPDPDVVIGGGKQVLADFQTREIILGTRPV